MIKIAICDDSEDFLEIMESKVTKCINSKFEMECTIFCFNNLDDLTQHVKENKTDIVFLDIMINDTNAMDWSIEHFNINYTQTIFVTSYPQCAYNISETNCCYYLMKSKIDNKSLEKALSRALQNIGRKNACLTIAKQGSKNFVIDFNDILYVETLNNNIILHLNSGENVTLYTTLKKYAKSLPYNFLRCHKCYMINMNHISEYSPHQFVLKNGDIIPIPPKKYKEFTSAYTNYLQIYS